MEQQSPFKQEEFEAVLDKEFSVFKNGEKYDFVSDLKDAFSSSLERPAAERISTLSPSMLSGILRPLLHPTLSAS